MRPPRSSSRRLTPYHVGGYVLGARVTGYPFGRGPAIDGTIADVATDGDGNVRRILIAQAPERRIWVDVGDLVYDAARVVADS